MLISVIIVLGSFLSFMMGYLIGKEAKENA